MRLVGTNNQIRIQTTTPAVGPTIISFPQGLYTVADLNDQTDKLLRQSGFDGDAIIWDEEGSTSKVKMTQKTIGTTVDFSVANSIAPLLGFDATPRPTSTVANEEVTSENIADLPPIHYFHVATSLVDEGALIGNKKRNVIAKIPVNVPANHQINFEPRHRVKYQCQKLAGNLVRSIEMVLYDQQLREVNTGGEYWSAVLMISWKQLVTA